MILKRTKYLIFKVVRDTGKTKVVSIINKSADDEIGKIEWYPRWRQYIFDPCYETIWNNSCLEDVLSVINSLMAEKHGKYNHKANNGD